MNETSKDHKTKNTGSSQIVFAEGGSTINRVVQVGGDLINSIINTGDYNQFFIGNYEYLRDTYINPLSVFERVRLERFTGREWLISEVDTFLRNHDRGYFILEAAAGLGKTSFLAYLVKERGYIHHFVEQAPGHEGIAVCLRNLAAQLILDWRLDPYLTEGILPGAASRPDFLQNLLVKVSQQRNIFWPNEKIVIVVDALDEAGTPTGQNVLGLPCILPEGVYFIVSQRLMPVTLKIDGPRRIVSLEAEEEKNLTDMRAYLETVATWSGVARELQTRNYTPLEFVETLLSKCRGVWIYLHYIVNDIECGERSPFDLSTLPEGVWQYYAQYWQSWREQNEVTWDQEHLPLLTTIAIAQEALSLPHLCILTGVKEQPAIRRLLQEKWRPFLIVEETSDGSRYRLYHTSLREFLEGQADLSRLAEVERSFAKELATATQQAHSQVANFYIMAWGGLEECLPRLRESMQLDLNGKYGLRHFTTHLLRGGRADDIHYLLELEQLRAENSRPGWGFESWRNELITSQRSRHPSVYENVWYVAKETVDETNSYLADVTHAWQLAEDAANNGDMSSIGLQCRYALITASLNSIAKNIPPKLLSALMKQGLWSPIRCLAYVRQIPNPLYRSDALFQIMSLLPESLFGEALDIVRQIPDENLRASVLIALTSILPHPLIKEALSIAAEIKNEDDRTHAMVGLIHYLPEVERGESSRDLLIKIRKIQDANDRWWGLGYLAPYLPVTDRLGVLQEAIEAAKMIEIDYFRTKALIVVITWLAKLDYHQESLATVRGIKDKWAQAIALAELIPCLPDGLREDILQEALKVALQTEEEIYQVEAVAKVLPYLSEPERTEALRKSKAIMQSVREVEKQAEVLVLLAPYLSATECAKISQKALITARIIPEAEHRAKVLAILVPYLPEGERHSILKEALAATQKIWIGDDNARKRVLTELAPHLPKPLLYEALAIVQKIPDLGYQMEVLVGLTTQLVKLGHSKKAVEIIQETQSEEWQVEILTELIPYLPNSFRQSLMVEDIIKSRKVRKKLQPILKAQSTKLDHVQHPKVMIWQGTWSMLLAELFPHLPKRLLPQFLAVVRKIPKMYDRANALGALALHLLEPRKEETLLEALKTAQKIDDMHQRANILAKLAFYLSEPLRGETLLEALTAGREIWNEKERVTFLAELASQLSEPLKGEVLREALILAQEMKDKYDQAKTLAKLAPFLAEPLLREALATVQKTESKMWRAMALSGLAPRLAELGYPEEALVMAREIEDEQERKTALAGVAPYLVQLNQENLYHLWQETLPILAARSRIDLLLDLNALASVIATLGGPTAVIETFYATRDVGQWWP